MPAVRLHRRVRAPTESASPGTSVALEVPQLREAIARRSTTSTASALRRQAAYGMDSRIVRGAPGWSIVARPTARTPRDIATHTLPDPAHFSGFIRAEAENLAMCETSRAWHCRHTAPLPRRSCASVSQVIVYRCRLRNRLPGEARRELHPHHVNQVGCQRRSHSDSRPFSSGGRLLAKTPFPWIAHPVAPKALRRVRALVPVKQTAAYIIRAAVLRDSCSDYGSAPRGRVGCASGEGGPRACLQC